MGGWRHRIGGARWLAAVALVSVIALAPRAAHGSTGAERTPFRVTVIDADAGYFRATGTCPANAYFLRYEWTPSLNGTGHGDIALGSPEVDVRLRMQAPRVGQRISVTLKCLGGGEKRMEAGPFTVASGNRLLPIPEGVGTGRRIVYSLAAQQVWAIGDDGRLARTYLVSGRRTPTYSGGVIKGDYEVFSKAEMGCILNGAYCPFMVRFATTELANVGFHAIPYSPDRGQWQTPQELGQPRSGGCVRSLRADATWLFHWSRVGDPVHVIDG